jgi:hypothetical protein
MQNNFVKRIEERRESDRTVSHLRYDDFRRMGYLRPITVRLPITTLAKMALLEGKLSEKEGHWGSRQEMLFEMIECCIRDWIDTYGSPGDDQEFQNVARRALQLHPPVREGDSVQDAPEEI